MSISRLVNMLEQGYFEYDRRSSSEFVSMVQEIHEKLWCGCEDYRAQVEFDEDGDDVAFYEVESISIEEFFDTVKLYLDMTHDDCVLLADTLKEIGSTLYFIREYRGNDNNVEINEVKSCFYNDFRTATHYCDEWIKEYEAECFIDLSGERKFQEDDFDYINFNSELLKKFMEVNSSVEVLDAEPERDESVPSHKGHHLRVKTKDHGWLHVYVNKYSGELEWY